MTAVIIILSLIIVGLLVALLWLSQKAKLLYSSLKTTHKALTEMEVAKTVAQTTLEQQKESYEQILADREKQYELRLKETRDSIEEKFKSMATDTLDVTVQRHSQMAKQSMETVLAPMREAFNRLSEEIERRGLDSKAERSLLQEGINSLRQLNIQVSDETKKLSNALRGNTGFQGRWGEMVLENILEGSGLERSRWIVYQESTTIENGERFRPDAVIHCPRSRDIIIDSKVSLTAYLNMIEPGITEAEREKFRINHVRSVETHLRGLSNKEYQNQIGGGAGAGAGFVLMFIPHEGAYLAAMQSNPELWQKAYDRNVVIVSPTHLVTVVRLVEQMWRTADQTANSIAIAEEATKMLDQFNDFLSDLVNVEKSLDKAREAAVSARKRLSTGNGNVLRRVQKLKSLGIKTKKDILLPPED